MSHTDKLTLIELTCSELLRLQLEQIRQQLKVIQQQANQLERQYGTPYRRRQHP